VKHTITRGTVDGHMTAHSSGRDGYITDIPLQYIPGVSNPVHLSSELDERQIDAYGSVKMQVSAESGPITLSV
jgi:hypothetical protein